MADSAGDAQGSRSMFGPASTWNIVQFGLMCSFTMSFSSLWNFPSYIYSHTGLFLVAYYVLLILVCIPVTFLQLKLGGVLQRGIIAIYSHYVPALKGVAVALLCLAFIQCIYHGVYLSLLLYYMMASLKQPYPWTIFTNSTATRHSTSYYYFAPNPAEHYLYNEVLRVSDSLASPGYVPWHMALILLLTWIIIFVFISRGPAWLAKVVYGSSPFAIFLLLVLLIYTHVAIPAAHKSLGHFYGKQTDIAAQFGIVSEAKQSDGILSSELASPMTWIHALEQHIYSLGLWAGILPTLGYHLGKRKPVSNHSWSIVLLIYSMLPHLGTITMAPLLHALAVHKDIPFKDVVKDGPELLFMVIPEAFASCSVSPFWSFLFYLCLFLFALHQQALVLLVILENVVECFPRYAQLIFRRGEFLAVSICTLAYLLGLPHVTQGGYYLTRLVEYYLFRTLPFLVILNTVPFILAYVKLDLYHLPIERLCVCVWFALASIVTCAMLLYNMSEFLIPYTQSLDSYSFPSGSHCLGWMIALVPPVTCIVLGFIHAIYSKKGGIFERLRATWQCSQTDIRGSQANEVDPDSYLASGEGGGTLKFRKKASKQHDPSAKDLHLNAAEHTVLPPGEVADNTQLTQGVNGTVGNGVISHANGTVPNGKLANGKVSHNHTNGIMPLGQQNGHIARKQYSERNATSSLDKQITESEALLKHEAKNIGGTFVCDDNAMVKMEISKAETLVDNTAENDTAAEDAEARSDDELSDDQSEHDDEDDEENEVNMKELEVCIEPPEDSEVANV